MNFFDRNCKSLSSSSLSSLSSSSSVNLQKISGVKRSSESWKSLSDVECARRNRARWLGRLSPSHRSFVTLKKGASDRAGTCSQYFFLKKVGHPRPLFLYFRLFNTHMFLQFLPMTGFKQRTSGIGSNRSTNWATTTAVNVINPFWMNSIFPQTIKIAGWTWWKLH